MVMRMLVTLALILTRAFSILKPCQCQRNLLLFFFNQESLHWIILIMFSNDLRQLSFLPQHWSLLLTPTLTRASPLPPLPTLLTTTLHLRRRKIHSFIIIFLFIPRMIHLQRPSNNHGTAQVVHCKIRAPLILILQKCEAL